MNAQPNAYKHAAKAALRMWQKRDLVIETGIDAHAMDHAMIDEMEQAAIMLRQLSERLYEAWQKRGGQSNDSGSFTVPATDQHAVNCETIRASARSQAEYEETHPAPRFN